jgi:thymidine kinase
MSHHTNGHSTHPATLDVIAGPMFSNKSLELIGRIRRVQYAKKKTLCFYPETDTRTEHETIGSRSLSKPEPAIACKSARDILQHITPNIAAVGIDEAQFWDMEEPELLGLVCLELVRKHGINVKVAGLDLDASDKPFEVVAFLMAIADRVTKTRAVCVQCGSEYGSRSQRLVKTNARTLVGDADAYEARCTHCFEPH